MKYFMLTLVVILTNTFQTEAQVKEVWRWSDQAVLPILRSPKHIIDESGNIVSSEIEGFDGNFITRAAKLSSDGNLLWNTIWDLNKAGHVQALNIDSYGSVYSVGNSVGPDDDSAMFCKYNANGTLSWNKIKVLDNSTVHLLCAVTSNGTMFAGITKQSVTGPPDNNCIKGNEIGSCSWYNSSGSGLFEYVSPSTGTSIINNHVWGMHTDNSGFVYLQNWVSVDTCYDWSTCERVCNTFLNSLYLIKLTSAGTEVYRKGGRNEHTAYAVTNNGQLYMTKPGGILEKYDQQGSLIWTGSLPANTWWHEIMVDPSEKTVKVFSFVNDYSSYYISSFASDGNAQWQITGPTANYSSTKKCLDYEGNLYLSNAPNKTIDRINNATGLYDWTYSADTSRIYKMKAVPGGDLIVIRWDYIQRLTQTTTLTLYDANQNTLADKEFYLIRVADDAPLFTPDTLGIVKTDADGKIQLTPVP